MAPSGTDSISPVVRIWNPLPSRRVIEAIRNVDAESAAAMREKAARLLRDEQVIASGPMQQGCFVWIPSPCWRPEFVEECKRNGGRFKKLDRLFNCWVVPADRMTLDQACELYARYFFREVAVSQNNLRLAEVGYGAQ
jgi:hypothetical protein